MGEKFCGFKWENFSKSVEASFQEFRDEGDFVDVTLVSGDGKQLKAHRIVLASASNLFYNILNTNKHSHPLIFMKGFKSNALDSILDYVYHGETQVAQENIEDFLAASQELQIKGLDKAYGPDEIQQEDIKEEVGTVLAKEEIVVTTELEIKKLEKTVNSMMERNLERTKGARNEWKCKVCGKTAMKANIATHIEARHIEGRSHPCYQCGTYFR